MSEHAHHTHEEQDEEQLLSIDLSVFFRDMLRSFLKFWWIVALLAMLCASFMLVRSLSSYRPYYRTSATFTVETYTTNENEYSFYYDNRTASQMALTFPYLLESDLLLERVMADLGVDVINGTPSAKVIENSNLFTLSVVSTDPQDSYDILQSLIRNYPVVAEYVIGRTQLNMIDAPEFPSLPYNHRQHLSSCAKGVVLGILLGLAVIAVHAVTRRTVRRETDIENKLHSRCLGCIPLVVAKKRTKGKAPSLSIHSDKVGNAFKESFRGIALHVSQETDSKNVLLVTAATEGEGTTTVAENLAWALADQGKKVLLLDGHFKKAKTDTPLEYYLLGYSETNPLVWSEEDNLLCLRCSRDLTQDELTEIRPRLTALLEDAKQQADLIIIDAPSCQSFDRLSLLAEHSHHIVLVIGQDMAKLQRIMTCIEDLNQFDASVLGCVLNGMQGGITGYGYGYGYSYGYGYGYGHGYGYGYRRSYGHYGYGERNKD